MTIEKSKLSSFKLSYKKPTVSFDLIYPYSYLRITQLVLSSRNGINPKRAGRMLDCFLRFTLRKTDGYRKSFSVNLIKYLQTMHVQPQTLSLVFDLDLSATEENLTLGFSSQAPYYHFVEVALEPNFSDIDKDIEFLIQYEDNDGLELNKL